LLYLPSGSRYTHPHNDYFRILHDYGIVGGALLLIGGFALIRGTKRVWRAAVSQDSSLAQPHLTAFLGTTALAFAMITDNVVIYVFFMAPLAILVGFSLGHASADATSSVSPVLHKPVAAGVSTRAKHP
jgi:O-antigen ligase